MLAVPPTKPLTTEDGDYYAGLKFSVIAHVFLAVAVIVKSLIFPSKPVPYIPSLRVDIVGLPDMLKKDLHLSKTSSDKEIEQALKKAELEAKRIKPKIPAEAEPALPDEMVLKPKPSSNASDRERKLRNALARIKALAKISANESKQPASPLIRGNVISKGSSLDGDARETSRTSYYDNLRERLRDNWTLPVWIARQNLSAQVQVFIDSRGRLRDFRFIKFSGNQQFDDAVKRAITSSQPFEIPSQELAGSLLVNGILIGFPL